MHQLMTLPAYRTILSFLSFVYVWICIDIMFACDMYQAYEINDDDDYYYYLNLLLA